MRRTAAILVLSTGLLAACGSEPSGSAPEQNQATPSPAATPARAEASITDARIQLPAAPGRPAAGYFKLSAATDDADILLSVTSPAAKRVELHQTLAEGTVSQMEKFDVLALSRGETIEFAPGGKHLMLFDLTPDVAAGQKVPLTFEFQSGKKITVEAEVRPAGS